MRWKFTSLVIVLVAAVPAAAEPAVSRVLPEDQRPHDARLEPQRTLNDAYHPWVPPTTRAAWDQEAQRLREQVLVSLGLWPLPEKSPLEPVIHGRVERDGYTVERVYFASRPGHYVTGSLFRPKESKGKIPGVLCPHGHWQNGRFYDAGADAAAEQIKIGAEEFDSGARSPLQARMIQLARMGCVVFHYDMVGVADNQPIGHSTGFNDVTAELWLQNKMGLQTWNSIRALDFVLGLPDVDPARIGVTGASGGGTQTFMLGAIDPRPTVAFPAVMVSTGMQGGCVCENASYLRHGINNIALAALFAPRPQALSGADDWTIEIESKGLPELKQVYALHGQADLVAVKCFPQFKHNYNQVAREMMFDWFNEHLGLERDAPVKQTDFVPLTREELTVFDAEHPVPADALPAEKMRALMTQETETWFAGLLPKSADGIAEYRRIVGTAARVMLDAGLPPAGAVELADLHTVDRGDYELRKGTCGRKGAGEQVPAVTLVPPEFSGTLVIWLDGRGKSHLFDAAGSPVPAVQDLLNRKLAVASADLFLTGEYLTSDEPPTYPVQANFPGYTFCYNRPLVSHRVHDILTLIGAARAHPDVKEAHLVATGTAGPWALMACGLAGDALATTTVDLGGFAFAGVTEPTDPMLLPGALRYGDIGGLAALAAPSRLTIHGAAETAPQLAALRAVYAAAGSDGLRLVDGPLNPEAVVREIAP